VKYSSPKIPEGINTTDENPLKEFAILTSGVISVVIALALVISYSLDWTSQFIPFSYEELIAQPFVDKYTNERGEIDDYLQELADKITPLMSLPDDMSIKVHYVDEDVKNAMATLGGNIFIYRGLLEKLPSENALVMLLGHEITHVKLRHPLKSLNKGMIISLLSAFVGGQTSSDVTGLLSSTGTLTLLSFSRDQEQESDYQATIMSEKYYGHTQGSIELLTILAQQNNKTDIRALEVFNSHPELQERIKFIEQVSKANNWMITGETVAIPTKISNAINNQ